MIEVSLSLIERDVTKKSAENSVALGHETDNNHSLNGQRHAQRDLQTYAKSVDPDQPPRLVRVCTF